MQRVVITHSTLITSPLVLSSFSGEIELTEIQKAACPRTKRRGGIAEAAISALDAQESWVDNGLKKGLEEEEESSRSNCLIWISSPCFEEVLKVESSLEKKKLMLRRTMTARWR